MGRSSRKEVLAMKNERGRRGQALVETAVAIIAVVLLAAGILEFGRAFMLLNMVTHATRDAARLAATLPKDTFRDDNGCFSGSNAGDRVRNYIDEVIGTVMDENTVDGLTISVGQCLAENTDVPLVQVKITGDVDAVTGLITAGTFAVDRTATYRDEGATVGFNCNTCPNS
jgi:Flp pilus assembly protein TadG